MAVTSMTTILSFLSNLACHVHVASMAPRATPSTRDAPRRCCTCSKQFPHRRMNGAPVKSYESLVSYLLAKDPRIKKTRLDFEGRNACLYFRP